jgi:4-amino-4-deoxychorismate lyase
MLDADGRLMCGTMTNVYAVIDGVVCTPAIVRCGVAGVMRAALLDAWAANGTATVIRDLEPGELKGASEIFLSNALIGVWPVRTLDGQEFARGPSRVRPCMGPSLLCSASGRRWLRSGTPLRQDSASSGK